MTHGRPRPRNTFTDFEPVIFPTESVDSIGVDGLGLLLGVALVELHELGQIELGLLENLDLLDADVLKREDLRALLSDVLGNIFR